MESGMELRCIRLATGRSLRVRDAAGRTVTCCAGTVWITQEGDARDIVLQAGQSFTLDRPGLTLISALQGMQDIWRGNTDIAAVTLPMNESGCVRG